MKGRINVICVLGELIWCIWNGLKLIELLIDFNGISTISIYINIYLLCCCFPRDFRIQLWLQVLLPNANNSMI